MSFPPEADPPLAENIDKRNYKYKILNSKIKNVFLKKAGSFPLSLYSHYLILSSTNSQYIQFEFVKSLRIPHDRWTNLE